MPEKKTKKKPHLKLIQGGKSDVKENRKSAPKMAAPKMATPQTEKQEKRVHPFSQFFGKPRSVTATKPNSREQVMSHQIPRKKAI